MKGEYMAKEFYDVKYIAKCYAHTDRYANGAVGRCETNNIPFSLKRMMMPKGAYLIELFEKVKEILVNELRIDEAKITREATLANDLGVNSLELAELVLVVEEQLNVEINEDDLHKFITVGDVADYLEALKK